MRKKTVFVVVLLVAFAVHAHGQQFEPEGNFRWQRDGSGVRIRGYTGNNTYVRIPPQIQGLSVVSIGADAFRGRGLTNVTIPNTVARIFPSAFENNRLTSVTIPGSVRVIGNGAFRRNQLTSVSISNGVSDIEPFAFRSNNLTSVIIPSSITRIGDGAFSDNRIASVNVPTGANIGIRAFGGATVTRGQQQQTAPQVAQQQPAQPQQQARPPAQQQQQAQQQQPRSQQQVVSGIDSRLIGTWEGTSWGLPMFLVFRADGTWQQTDANMEIKGTFTVRGNVIELRQTRWRVPGSAWVNAPLSTGHQFSFPSRDRLRLELFGELRRR